MDAVARGLAAKGLAKTNTVTPLALAMARRAPQRSDDSTKGFAVGDYWHATEIAHPKVWKALGVAAGAAQWALQQPSATPLLNQVGGTAPIAAYGLAKLRAAYAGSCLQITRASDSTTLDVGFVQGADGVYRVDVAAADVFCQGTLGYITKLYDQSGNANDATQATTAKAVVWSTTTVEGLRVLSFDGTTNASTILQRYFDLPAGVSVNLNATSVMLVCKPKSSYGLSALWQLGLTANTNILNLLNTFSAGTRSSLQLSRVGANGRQTAQPRTTMDSYMTVSSGTSNAVTTRNEETVVTGPTATSQTLTGGYLGGEDGVVPMNTYNALFDFQAFVVWGRALSVTEQRAAKDAAYQHFRIRPQRDFALTILGDSITNGASTAALGVSYNRNWFYHAEKLLRLSPKVHNLSVPGYRTYDIDGYKGYALAPTYDSSKTNVLTYWCGTNDLVNSGNTAAATEPYIASTIAAAKALGFKVVIGTITPASGYAGDSAKEAERQALNAWIRAGSSGADAIADVAADPVMGPLSAASDTTLYGDGLHLTELGTQYIAPYWAAAIESLVPAP